MQSCPLNPERVSSKTSLNTFPLDRRMRTRRLQLFGSKLFVPERHKWKPHCLCEIHCGRTDQRRFIGSAMLPWLVHKVVTANEAAVLYLWQHLYEVHCYPLSVWSPSM